MNARQIPFTWAAGAVMTALIAGAALRGALADPPKPDSTSPTDGPPSVGVVRTSSPGPKRWLDGVPSGFSHDEDGAQAAAVTFSSLAGSLVNANPASVDSIVSAISTKASAAQRVAATVAALDALRSRLAGGTGPIVLVQAPVLIRTDDYSDAKASITMWTTTVVARRGVADPQSTWSTITLELLWERGDWRLDQETTLSGPTPDQSTDAAPPSFDAFEAALHGSRPVGSAR